MAREPANIARVQSTAQSQRDEAIQRVGWTRRAAIGAAAALTALIAAAVSAIAPGRTLGASRPLKSTAAPARSSTSIPRMPALASGSQLGLSAGSAPQSDQASQPPPVQQAPVQQAPVQQAPVQQAPPVVSGGS
jgi:hypothetical protein